MKQGQHKIPQVYLKQFGYNIKGHWKVTIINKGDSFTRQKSIKGFTKETNVFTIQSNDNRIKNIFEWFNGALETEYHNIIRDLDTTKHLSGKSLGYLIMLIGNLIVRSDYWRNVVLDILGDTSKENFLKKILISHTSNAEEFQKLLHKPQFNILINKPPTEIINRVLLYFCDYLTDRLQYCDVVIIEAPEEKPWFTSDNPVIVHNRTDPNRYEIFSEESEVYFPVSPKYMVYIHYRASIDKDNHLRKYEHNKIYLATNDESETLNRLILDNPSDSIIFPSQFRYTKTA